MKTLLLHPEDSPRRGPWTHHKWDLLVDLGKTAASTAEAWQKELGCPVLRLDSFRQGVRDLAYIGNILRSGRGRLVDSERLDWWDLSGILLQAELEFSLLLLRLAPQLGAGELFATRSAWQTNACAALLNRDLHTFGHRAIRCPERQFKRYGQALRNLSWAQVAEIFFDKYDADYRWRQLLRKQRRVAGDPRVLVPSAYTNVSRMAAAYARMLPEQQFLFVTTRRSGTRFELPPNVSVTALSSYLSASNSRQELSCILQKWRLLQSELLNIPEFHLLERCTKFKQFPRIFSQGLAIRDLWREVLDREPVTCVFCGDDSNPHTRIPVALAEQRRLRTIDFHHGALDGRFLLKTLPSDLYLAKSEMERDYLLRVCGLAPTTVPVGAPRREISCHITKRRSQNSSQVVLFSEPYESAGGRADEIYRELLPRLARIARHSGKKLVIKLHPFESPKQRSRLIKTLLSREDEAITQVTAGPVSQDFLLQTWFGVTVESTSVLDCTLQGVPCFLCRWLVLSSYEYVQQYARFGVGIILNAPDQIHTIPSMVDGWERGGMERRAIWQQIEPQQLSRYLGSAELRSEYEEEVPQVHSSVMP